MIFNFNQKYAKLRIGCLLNSAKLMPLSLSEFAKPSIEATYNIITFDPENYAIHRQNIKEDL
jgi:hypothetical protein